MAVMSDTYLPAGLTGEVRGGINNKLNTKIDTSKWSNLKVEQLKEEFLFVLTSDHQSF